ncbi:MAG: hypothetical protein HKUEN07_11470 [Rhodocyclaceae bacterium]|nr:MAG: hypothetical protein BroJett012_15410 [Betaproteobacteria bacterium]GJQ54578.1 MAG: hypothetical protein HKUEN07_11470 [Rhodocyclaceae bacterium]
MRRTPVKAIWPSTRMPAPTMVSVRFCALAALLLVPDKGTASVWLGTLPEGLCRFRRNRNEVCGRPVPKQ